MSGLHKRELQQQMAERNWKSWLRTEQQAKTIQELLEALKREHKILAQFADGANDCEMVADAILARIGGGGKDA